MLIIDQMKLAPRKSNDKELTVRQFRISITRNSVDKGFSPCMASLGHNE